MEAKSGELGTELQAGLDAVYTYAAGHSLPIMTHAQPTELAAESFASRTSPEHWKPVIALHPSLRLCIGHFSFCAQSFIAAVGKDLGIEVPAWVRLPMPKDCVWPVPAYQGTQQLIGPGKTVFFDIAYLDGMFAGDPPDQAADFFRFLRLYLRKYDPDLTQMLFGSDWIFIDREHGGAGFAARVVKAMQDAHWQPEEINRVLHGNVQAYLAA